MLSPKAVDDSGFTVEPDPDEPGGFVVRGAKPERWVRQTQFDNDEAVGYLADRLARLGVEEELAKLGALPGASVTIARLRLRLRAHRRAWPTRSTCRPAGAPTSGWTPDTGPTPTSGWRRRRPAASTVSDEELLLERAAERRQLSRRTSPDAERAAGPIAAAARTVVKVGSSSLTSRGRLQRRRLDALVDALAARRAAGQQVVLVSSGAIAAGIAPLGLKSRPRDLATQQAAASVGQLLLAERYAASFARHGLTVGQVLLTADDLHRRGSLPQRGADPGAVAGARA